MEGKVCDRCKTAKPPCDYARHSGFPDGFRNNCRACCNKQQRDRARELRKRKADAIDMVGTKFCPRCKQQVAKVDFQVSLSRGDGLHYMCRKCQSEHSKARLDRHHKRIAEAKKGKACAKCGEDDPRVLEFDHVVGIKTAPIAALALCSDKRFKDELAKTQILCILCHREKTSLTVHQPEAGRSTASYMKTRARNRRHINECKMERGGCDICGLVPKSDRPEHMAQFDFDHIDRATKSFNVSLGVASFAISRLDAEIAKCRLLCCACHAKHTREQMGFFKYE